MRYNTVFTWFEQIIIKIELKRSTIITALTLKGIIILCTERFYVYQNHLKIKKNKKLELTTDQVRFFLIYYKFFLLNVHFRGVILLFFLNVLHSTNNFIKYFFIVFNYRS